MARKKQNETVTEQPEVSATDLEAELAALQAQLDPVPASEPDENAFDAPGPDYVDPNASTGDASTGDVPNENDDFTPPAFLQNDASIQQAAAIANEHRDASEAQAEGQTVDWSKVAPGSGTGFEVQPDTTSTDGSPVEGEPDDALANVNATMANTSFTAKEFNREVRKFGEQYGQGANSLPALALRGVEAAQRLPEVGPKNAEEIISEFLASAGKKATLEYKRGASFKVQVSKYRQFLEVAVMGNGIDAYDVMHRGVDVIKKLAADPESGLQNSLYENLVKVARRQRAQKDRALTDEEILNAVMPNAKSEKSELEKLGELLGRVRKAHDWAPNESKLGLEDAAHAIEDAIKAAGGTVS